MKNFDQVVDWFHSVWNLELFHLGESIFTTRTIILLIISLFLLLFLASKIRKLLVKKIFPRYNLDVGVSQAIANIVRYFLVLLGLLIIFQTTGIDLSALGILIGALGIGIGFGLQSVTNNFISGIIILFERPVKVGDRVEIDDLSGNIVKISARATTIITNDNITVIVPNSDFINSRVINWSHNDRNVRLNFPVGVSYKEDPEMIRKILIQVADENPGVLKNPRPEVLFDEFADSSLNFILRVWTSEYIDTPIILKSQLYYAIFTRFKENAIEIPYPQRDIHLRTGFEMD
ncbi:MAG TPA: mechanosensitive ion channel [Bacteroidales bacterium]|nr:mechanosensitive ion channel [Bacteroidales bacterium]HNS45990.1 mechanosensitive ion channel [Bacteroidales bacterium]